MKKPLFLLLSIVASALFVGQGAASAPTHVSGEKSGRDVGKSGAGKHQPRGLFGKRSATRRNQTKGSTTKQSKVATMGGNSKTYSPRTGILMGGNSKTYSPRTGIASKSETSIVAVRGGGAETRGNTAKNLKVAETSLPKDSASGTAKLTAVPASKPVAAAEMASAPSKAMLFAAPAGTTDLGGAAPKPAAATLFAAPAAVAKPDNAPGVPPGAQKNQNISPPGYNAAPASKPAAVVLDAATPAGGSVKKAAPVANEAAPVDGKTIQMR